MAEIKVPLPLLIQMKINKKVAELNHIKVQLEQKNLEIQQLVAEQAEAKAQEYIDNIEEQKKNFEKQSSLGKLAIPGSPGNN